MTEKMEKMLLQMMMNEDGIHQQFLVWLMTRLSIFLTFVSNTVGFLLPLSRPGCVIVFVSWGSLGYW